MTERRGMSIRNPLKARLARGEAVWGTFVFEYGSPAVPRIMQAAGWDYILIDMEHASFGMETVPAFSMSPRPWVCRPWSGFRRRSARSSAARWMRGPWG